MGSEERHRLVVLGSSRVGKSAILHRYLHKEFSERHKETVEDLYARDFSICGSTLRLDIVDTSFHYPDMRRLTIQGASAFLVVLAVDNVVSFKHASDLMQEIIETRGNEISDLPIVVVGNKIDLEDHKTAEIWLMQTCSALPKASITYVETSAKTGEGIVAAFRELLAAAQWPPRARKSGLLSADSGELGRSRSFRSRSTRRKGAVRDAGTRSPGGEEPAPLSRHGSLIRKGAARLSFKARLQNQEPPKDESDCIIS